jgi:hypothetical protein
MTVVYFIVWLFSDTPHISLAHWNTWGTALVICIAIDLMGSNQL